MKKVILTLVFCLIPHFSLAANIVEINYGNDYILTTDNKIETTVVNNPDILTVSPFFTIFNEKNVLLIHPEKVGKSNLIIFQKGSETVFEINVRPNKTNIPTSITKGSFDFSLLDKPPKMEDFSIDPPPIRIKEKL